ncbi:hypothetical protein JNB_19148 [Janibacter sp. HTCC2649]|uniref:hypothetical protein n=1 Tax=Janibacter sp. HTCC2649 TaxID=313589 RepID=UPI0000671002|nr:hypothetical protein [Janibacter sp. HTCC2649]EAP97618.1 hypothetical protein JNB_19148 [Janibacter sp. HTCC2649]
MAISASFLNQPDLGSGWFTFVIGPGSLVLQLMSLTGAGFVVAAVVADRREVPQPDDEVQGAAADQPSASHVVVEDPLAYDPADFEPPRLMS